MSNKNPKKRNNNNPIMKINKIHFRANHEI